MDERVLKSGDCSILLGVGEITELRKTKKYLFGGGRMSIQEAIRYMNSELEAYESDLEIQRNS